MRAKGVNIKSSEAHLVCISDTYKYEQSLLANIYCVFKMFIRSSCGQPHLIHNTTIKSFRFYSYFTDSDQMLPGQ